MAVDAAEANLGEFNRENRTEDVRTWIAGWSLWPVPLPAKWMSGGANRSYSYKKESAAWLKKKRQYWVFT